MAVGKGQVSTDVVDLVSLRENLRAELTAQISICGQLSDQHALVVATEAIHGHGRHDVPSAANAVIHREAVTSLEGIHPRSWNQLHTSFSNLRLPCQTNRHVAVVRELWNQGHRT